MMIAVFCLIGNIQVAKCLKSGLDLCVKAMLYLCCVFILLYTYSSTVFCRAINIQRYVFCLSV